MTFILIKDGQKNIIKSIKNTYHSLTWLFFYWIIQLKDKQLAVWPKQEAFTYIEITILVLKMPRSRLVHTSDWLVTVMLWLSDSENGDLLKYIRRPHCNQQPRVYKTVLGWLPLTPVVGASFEQQWQ